MAASKHSTKRRKDPKSLSFEEISKLPASEFAEALYAKAYSEKKPVLSTKLVEAIEAFVQNSSPARSAALAYLSRPWRETTTAIQKDRNIAVASANVYHALDDLAARYRDLAAYIQAAEMRLMLALCSREDAKAVMQEGRTEAHHG